MDDQNPVIEIQLSRPDAVMPTRGHETDVGYDLTIVELVSRLAPDVFLYDTGVRVAPPSGYHIEVVPRSSISKSGFMLANSIGIIDESYRGNVMISLRKIDHKASNPALPSRVAQMIVRKTERADLRLVDELGATARGEGGFGSTG
jgi:dUTP pyrophosphatase